MNGIIGMTELALGTDLTAEQRDYLGTVRGSAESLLTIINGILDFSKIEAGKFILEAQEFHLEALVEGVLKLFALHAEQKGLELAYDASPDLPELVIGDAARLRQVLVNLIGNAIKFTEAGEVVLQARLLGVERSVARVQFSVSDTGVGIPQDRSQAIFEPFVQADASCTRRHGGTGLGLTISARLVGLMNGRMWVESRVGAGSTFHFTAEFQTAAEGAAPPPALDALAELPVLVVDDNLTVRRILSDMLDRWRMRPAQARSGFEALEMLERERAAGRRFALVLLDRHMPGMDAAELARSIRQNSVPPAPRIVMLLSASDSIAAAAQIQEAGLSEYLIKPVTPGSLRNGILGTPGGSTARAVEIPAAQAIAGSGLRILLAEDHPVNQKVAARMLEKFGHVVSIANDGREAMDAFLREQFDLILLDVQMPGMNGYEVSRAIRAHEAAHGGKIPIVGLTANALKGDRELCLDAGMDEYLSKPVQSRQLQDAIGRCCAAAAPT
jgi:two-component system, sensor histidine kinase and response regulator